MRNRLQFYQLILCAVPQSVNVQKCMKKGTNERMSKSMEEEEEESEILRGLSAV